MFQKLFSSPLRTVGFLIIGALLLGLPLLISLYSQRQPIERREPIIQKTNQPQGNQVQIISTSGNTSPCTVDASDLGLDTEEASFVSQINQYRQSSGLGPLATSSNLSQMAAWIVNDNSAQGAINHTDSLGRNTATRAQQCGVTNYNVMDGGEILTAGTHYSTATDALNAWKASPGHNASMLKPGHVQMGVARVHNPNNTLGWFWATVFGSSNDGTTAPILPAATPTTAPTAVPPTAIPPTPLPTSPTSLTPTPTTPPGLTPQPTQAATGSAISVIVKIPGVGGNTTVGENPKPVEEIEGEVKLNAPSTTPITLKLVPNNFTFKGTVSNLRPGSYSVKIRIDNSLWKDAGTIVLGDGPTSTQTVTLITGDLNSDNVLNLSDYNLFISCYGTRPCAQKVKADLNIDGKVDEKDLNIFYTALAKREGD